MSPFQWPDAFANPTIPRNRAATPNAIAQAGRRRGDGDFAHDGSESSKAPSTGQMPTHSRHPVHSADLIVISLSTGKFEGHAFAHFAQSMQAPSARRMRSGLKNETIPSSAPYGHR